ncbi:MAG TPA: GGDEF domain-containing protein, partial [Holophagaceae bacterium]|nr:GGDEF domain-containing protein [Holophagaceae bacterium]
EGVVFMDRDARILACNPSAERILGWSESQLAGRASVDERLTAIHEDGSAYAVDAHPSIRTLRTGRPCVGVVQGLQNAEGQRTWISINAQPLQHPWEDKPHGVVVSFSDITRLKEAEARLLLEATHDALTGLRNRRHFVERLGAALKVAKRHGDPLSLCVCDLDAFKQVNDTHGHATGDAALQRMAALLREELRGEEDLPARLGGDEFVVLFPRSSAAQAAVSMERVRRRLQGEPIRTEAGAELVLSGSFGIAQLAELTTGQEELFEDADRALYEAKRTGRNRVVIAAERRA